MQDDKGRWNPYLAGALTGLLMIASIWFVGKYFGASTSFVRSAGLIESVFTPERVQQLDYFAGKVSIDWQWMFVAGIFLGSLLSSLVSGSFKIQPIADSWRERFGPSLARRGVTGFIGGILVMYGARLAGG